MIYYRIFRRISAQYRRSLSRIRIDSIVNIVRNCTYRDQNGEVVIDASELKNQLFPAPQRVIFISHLHSDASRAVAIKRYIESILPGYSCFIDSEVWHNVYDAINLLKTEYAFNENGNFSCSDCSPITKNLYLMLSMALMDAIRSSAAFIYIPSGNNDNTLNSISVDSPWVCQELLTSLLIPEAPIRNMIYENLTKKASPVIFKYRPPVKHLRYGSVGNFIEDMR